MDKFKKTISDHGAVPMKMGIILYVILLIYSYNKTGNAEFLYNFGITIGIFILYAIIYLIAESISYNKKSYEYYAISLNETLNNKVLSFLCIYNISDDKIGVFIKTPIYENNELYYIENPIENPIEFYYTLEAYSSLLSSTGTYLSSETIKKLELFKQKAYEMISTDDKTNVHKFYARM